MSDNIKVGDRILESFTSNIFVVTGTDLILEAWGANAYKHNAWSVGQPIKQDWPLDRLDNTIQSRGFSILPPLAPEKKTRRAVRKNGRNDLFLAASKDGMTFKGLANQVNARKIDTFGVNATQALSRYEDRFGKKLDPNEAVVFKLVPYTVRIDKKNGRMRIGHQIRAA